MGAIRLLLGVAFLGSGTARSDDERFQTGLPIHEVFPDTSGIIFPSLLSAAGVNPAALAHQNQNIKALGLSYTPPVSSSGTQGYLLSYASGGNKLGWGVGYQGKVNNGSLSHGIFLGGGFQSEGTAIGLSLREPDIADGFFPETDLGIIVGTKSDVTLGLVLYHMQETPQLDLGLGFGNRKTYNFEINLLMPPIGTAFQSGSEYIVTAATTVYAYVFGLSFRSSYSTASSQVTQTVSLLVKLMKNLAVAVQYQSPNKSYYGIQLAF